jgi:hypothetical protein
MMEVIKGSFVSSLHFSVSGNARRVVLHVIQSLAVGVSVADAVLVVMVALALTVVVEVGVAGDDACCGPIRALLGARSGSCDEDEECGAPCVEGDTVKSGRRPVCIGVGKVRGECGEDKVEGLQGERLADEEGPHVLTGPEDTFMSANKKLVLHFFLK